MRRFVFKVLTFVITLLIVYWAFEIYRLEKFSDRFFELAELNNALDENVNAIMFGSSVNTYFSQSDHDKRSIAEMVDSLTTIKVAGINRGAFQLDIFFDFCQYMIRNNRMPQMIIIPINMRSFSPVWDLRPEYQFVRRRRILIGFPYIHFRARNIDYRKFNNTPVYRYNKKVGKVNTYIYHPHMDSSEAVRKGLVLNYLYPLKRNHRKLKSMRAMTELLVKHRIIPLYYIEPIDYRKGELIYGEQFSSHIKSNIDCIQSILSKYNLKALNLCFALNSEYFDYAIVPNEHMHAEGRIFVAETLARQVNQTILK